MSTYFFSKFKNSIIATVLFSIVTSTSLQAAEAPKEKIKEWISSCPWLGLIAREISYGPVTLKDFDLEKSGRVIIAAPGEEVNGTVRYKIDSDHLNSWNLHHIIIGMKDQPGQICLTHTLGLGDKHGKAHFTLKAPYEKGLYEVRFDHQEGLFCKDAIAAWQTNEPSSRATVGIIIVE